MGSKRPDFLDPYGVADLRGMRLYRLTGQPAGQRPPVDPVHAEYDRLQHQTRPLSEEQEARLQELHDALMARAGRS